MSHKLILKMNRQCIEEVKGNRKYYYELTKREFKLMTMLVDNNMHTYKEIQDFLNVHSNTKYNTKLFIMLYRLKHKLPVKIYTLNRVGCRLDTEIWIDN